MPVITRLKAADRRATRTTVDLDGERWADLDTEVVLKHHLAKGRDLSEAECDAFLEEDAFIRARRVAAGLLQLRMRSAEELRRKLREYRPAPRRKRRNPDGTEADRQDSRPVPKPFSEVTIDAVVAYFAETDRLNDAEFARRYVRHHLKLKTVGRRRLRNELLQLGVAEKVVERALAEEFPEGGEEQEAMVRKFIERRLPRLRREDPRRRRDKLRGALLRAGFEPDVFLPVMKAILRDEAIEDFAIESEE